MKYSAADSIAMQLIKKHQIKDSFLGLLYSYEK